jgi:hypothetical protein
MPRHLKNEGEDTDSLAPIWLEALPDSLMTDGAHGESGRLTADYYDLLVVEQLLGDDGG